LSRLKTKVSQLRNSISFSNNNQCVAENKLNFVSLIPELKKSYHEQS
jgi:hypothetical protein